MDSVTKSKKALSFQTKTPKTVSNRLNVTRICQVVFILIFHSIKWLKQRFDHSIFGVTYEVQGKIHYGKWIRTILTMIDVTDVCVVI